MTLTDFGTIGLFVTAVAYDLLFLGMLFLVPWYRSDIGRSLFASKALLAYIFTMIAISAILALPREHLAMSIARVIVYTSAPIIAVSQFYTLIIKHQIFSKRRISNRRMNERTEPGTGQAGAGRGRGPR